MKIDGEYMPKVKLRTSEEVYKYCELQHLVFPEVRVTDEDDYCVMRTVNHVMYVPFPDGNFKALNLITKQVRDLNKEQMEAEIEAQKVSP